MNRKRKTNYYFPNSESRSVKFYNYDKQGRASVIISGVSLSFFRHNNFIKLKDVRILYLDVDKDVTGNDYSVEISGDNALFYYDSSDFEIWGNVVMIKQDEIRIESDRVYWDNDDEVFYAPDGDDVLIFKVIDEDGKLNFVKTVGNGLWASRSLGIVRFRDSVNVKSDF